MKIGEIPPNSTIQIRAIKGDMKFECSAVVVATRDDGLFLAPVKHEGHIIDFSSDGVQLLAFYVNDMRQAFGWSGCRIRKDTYRGKMCHLLVTKRDSVRVNRRTEPRIKTDMNATARSIFDDSEREITVCDISANGIGFFCEKNIPERDWATMTVIYEDRLEGLYESMRVHILREMEQDNGRFRYGARILQSDEAWPAYVQDKLQKLRERREAAKAANAEKAESGTRGR